MARTVTLVAKISSEKCTGCGLCIKVCPTMALSLRDRRSDEEGRGKKIAEVNPGACYNVQNCLEICPNDAVVMRPLERPFTVSVDVSKADPARIEDLAARAGFPPPAPICPCTETTVAEIAAAILLGADTPEKVSLATGARTGCTEICAHGVLALLAAAGHRCAAPDNPEEHYRIYDMCGTMWERLGPDGSGAADLAGDFPTYPVAGELRDLAELRATRAGNRGPRACRCETDNGKTLPVPRVAGRPAFVELKPPPLMPLWDKKVPADIVAMRAAGLPGISALPIRALIPGLPPVLWAEDPSLGPNDPDAIRRRAREQACAMDWSKIRRDDTVNLIANPHGFFLCGEAYVVMLEEVAAHLERNMGVRVRLRIAESMGHIANPDWVRRFDLANRFKSVKEVPQISRGVKVDTRLGPFWLSHDLFDADHFVHTHVTEMREGYLHRMVDRLYKPFGMAYTRVETRSSYHLGFGPRTGQMVARAVFESDFVRKRYVGTMVLDTTPEGVAGVYGDNELGALNRRLTVNVLRNYGTLIRLMASIDECIVVFDGHGSGMYCYAGGIAFDNLFCANIDFFDLDNLGMMAHDRADMDLPGLRDGTLMGLNQAIKCIVMNYMAAGVPQPFLYHAYPLFVVGDALYRWLRDDPCSGGFAANARVSPDLPAAMDKARRESGTDKVIVYDRTPGVLRVSESLADFLVRRAPEVAVDVECKCMPKWLAQRGLA